MGISIDQAKSIVQAATIDIWNTPSKADRLQIWERHFAPKVKAVSPTGVVTIGWEEGDKHYDGIHADGRSDWKFKGEGDLWLNGQTIMHRWWYGKGEEGWKGWDVIEVDENGRIELLVGLMEGVHNHSD